MRTLLLLGLGSLAAAATAEPEPLPLPAPSRIELYLDGARLVETVAVPAGRTRILLPAEAGTLLAVEDADTWVEEQRTEGVTPPPLPPTLVTLTTRLQDLVQRQERLSQDQDTCQRLEEDLITRLGQRGLGQRWEISAWQSSLDGILALQGTLTARAVALQMDRHAFQEQVAHDAAPGLTYAQVLGGQALSGAMPIADPARFAARCWEAATARTRQTRILVITRAQAGPVAIVSERNDLQWTPQARLLVGHGVATLVRQATILFPAGFVLAGTRARMIGGTRAQALAGKQAQPRWIAAGNAPQSDHRSVQETDEAATWDQPVQATASREQTWELPSLVLSGPSDHEGFAVVELQQTVVPIVADEWILAPAIEPVLVRRLSVRIDDHPLAQGDLEVVVDGTVLGHDPLREQPAGTVLQLAAGEDQRVFVAGQKEWEVDPDRPPNHKRAGITYRIRNLSHEAIRCTGYLTHPVSAAKEVTVTIDPATTPGWTEPQPGILRWELTIPPGTQLPLQVGWVLDAAGKIRL